MRSAVVVLTVALLTAAGVVTLGLIRRDDVHPAAHAIAATNDPVVPKSSPTAVPTPMFQPGKERMPAPPYPGLASRATFCPILMYHYIRNYHVWSDPIGVGLSVAPRTFAAEMSYIRDHGYHTITLARLAGHIRYGWPLPAHPVAITLDDGYHDQFTKALPVLRRLHLTATFFIVSGFVNTPRYMNWWQVRTLQRDGMEVGVHTIHHLDLSQLSAAQDWQEIHGSKVAIEQHLGSPATVFAYPSGRFDPVVLRDVRKAGFVAAVSTLPGTLHAQKSLYYLFRVEVLGGDSVQVVTNYLNDRFGYPFEQTPTVP